MKKLLKSIKCVFVSNGCDESQLKDFQSKSRIINRPKNDVHIYEIKKPAYCETSQQL
jgi:hypothetical protein